jgi:hypothetical protein
MIYWKLYQHKNLVERRKDMEMKDYLEHYGVLGMKWGHHRGYDTPGPSTERYKKKLSSPKITQSNKKKYQAFLKESKAHDKRMNDYVRKTSVGNLIAQSILMSGWGATSYNSLRADGIAKGHAISLALDDAYVDTTTLGVTSLIRNRTYREPKIGLRATIRR